jgi:hypothetical protein
MTKRTSDAPRTVSGPKSRGKKGAPSSVAWEIVLDRLRLRLKGKPTRTTVFGRAGLRHSKMLWMRRQPDLRISVVVKLSRVLKVTPGRFLDLVVAESRTDRLGEIHF